MKRYSYDKGTLSVQHLHSAPIGVSCETLYGTVWIKLGFDDWRQQEFYPGGSKLMTSRDLSRSALFLAWEVKV